MWWWDDLCFAGLFTGWKLIDFGFYIGVWQSKANPVRKIGEYKISLARDTYAGSKMELERTQPEPARVP